MLDQLMKMRCHGYGKVRRGRWRWDIGGELLVESELELKEASVAGTIHVGP